MEQNGLALCENQNIFDFIIPESITQENWKNYLYNELFSIPTYFIAYLHYAVIIGKHEQGKLKYCDTSTKEQIIEEDIPFQFLQKLRVFNKDAELYIWKTIGKFKGRIRSEKEFPNCNQTQYNDQKIKEYVQADQILFGTYKEQINENFTILKEDRGTEVILPFSYDTINVQEKGNDNPIQRVAIRTRNYIGYNEIGQAGYIDCRFVEFVKRDKDDIYTWDDIKKNWVLESK